MLYLGEMNFEHFKTCVRAYFPNHDFSWIRDCRMHFHEPFCLSEADIRDVAIHFDLLTPGDPIPDGEECLMRYLKWASNMPGINPDTLEFEGDLYLMQYTADDRGIALVLVDLWIGTYPREIATI